MTSWGNTYIILTINQCQPLRVDSWVHFVHPCRRPLVVFIGAPWERSTSHSTCDHNQRRVVAIVCSIIYGWCCVLYMHDISETRPHETLDDDHTIIDFVGLFLGHGVVIGDVSHESNLPGGLTSQGLIRHDEFESWLVGICSLQQFQFILGDLLRIQVCWKLECQSTILLCLIWDATFCMAGRRCTQQDIYLSTSKPGNLYSSVGPTSRRSSSWTVYMPLGTIAVEWDILTIWALSWMYI